MRNKIIPIVMACFLAGLTPLSVGRHIDSEIEIFFEDFESDDGGFFSTLDWEWGDYLWVGTNCDGDNYPPPSAYSGDRMWGTILNDCYNNLGNNSGYNVCENSDPTDDSILSFTVDLNGYSNATLTFYEWFDSFLEWDWAEIYVNDDVVFQHCGTPYVPPDSWELVGIDLTPWTGDEVTIAFHYLASSVVNKAGWYIDDVRIFTTPATPTPEPTATPTQTPVPTNTPPPTPTPTPDCINHGDVNLDGVISAADAQLAFLITLGTYIPTYEEECAADCNGDGVVSAADAQLIFLTVLGQGNCVDPL
jgi:hypothetical protein